MNPKPRTQFSKRNLWPWKHWMTIGIGVLGTDNARPNKPNTVVLMADTMGSYGDEYSHHRLHKTFDFPNEGLYATAADQVDRAAELLPMIAARLAHTPSAGRTYGEIRRIIAESCFLYKAELFQLEVLPRIGIPPNAFDRHMGRLISNSPAHIDAEVTEEWKKFRIGCDLIIGTFDLNGQAFILTVNGSSETLQEGTQEGTQNWSFPGFAAIGTGGGDALFWLSRRGHALGMGVARAAYHAYEAKLMAESAPNVNEFIDYLIATPEKHWTVTSHKRTDIPAGCPVSLDWLEQTYARLGPQPTNELETKQGEGAR